MEDLRYQLVFQLPEATNKDFDLLVNLEEALINVFDGSPHEVDGHDFGSGTMNIFIDTNDPAAAFALAKEIVDPGQNPLLKVAYRSFDEGDYTLIWPEDSSEDFNLI